MGFTNVRVFYLVTVKTKTLDKTLRLINSQITQVLTYKQPLKTNPQQKNLHDIPSQELNLLRVKQKHRLESGLKYDLRIRN